MPVPDAARAVACLGPGHADRSTMAILARHAALTGDGVAVAGELTMVKSESCATCRFRVEITGSVVDRASRSFVDVTDHECRAEPPRPKAPFPWTAPDRWCGFWSPVPPVEAGEPAHYAATRAATRAAS